MTDQTVSADAVEAVARALMVGVFGDDALIAFDPPEDAPQYMKDAAAKRCERARRDARAAIAALDAHRATSLPDDVRGLVERLRQRDLDYEEWDGQINHIPDPDCNKAADTIEALSAEVEQRKASWEVASEGWAKAGIRAEQAECRAMKAEAELAEARAALRDAMAHETDDGYPDYRTRKLLPRAWADKHAAALTKAAEQTADT